jgi:hypothetical protein
MSLANIPSSVAKFFAALETRSARAIAEALGPKVIIEETSKVHSGGEAISHWCVEQSLVAREHRLLHGHAQGGQVVVSTLPRVDTTSATAHTRWSFAMAGDKIATVTVDDELGPDLPEPAAAFIRATNQGKLEALLATFAEGALVNDQLHEYWGAMAIDAWATREVIAQRLSLLVCRVRTNHEQVVVTASVDGSFDQRGLPDPLLVTFYFSSRLDKITQLLILPNESAP